jgi:hypothetical protein
MAIVLKDLTALNAAGADKRPRPCGLHASRLQCPVGYVVFNLVDGLH